MTVKDVRHVDVIDLTAHRVLTTFGPRDVGLLPFFGDGFIGTATENTACALVYSLHTLDMARSP
jgi:hypothetical protein